MTIPNMLTLLRIILIIPLIVVSQINSLYTDEQLIADVYLGNWIMLGIFVVASLTDFLDGYLARKWNQVTSFGKFADPLADKLLVFASLLYFITTGLVADWVVMIILAREFIVTGVRLVAASEGKVIAASNLGKYKTASTMFAIIFLYIDPLVYIDSIEMSVGGIIMIIAVALTIISGIDYFWKNKDIVLESV